MLKGKRTPGDTFATYLLLYSQIEMLSAFHAKQIALKNDLLKFLKSYLILSHFFQDISSVRI